MSYDSLAFHTNFGTIVRFLNTKQLKTNCLIQRVFGLRVALGLMSELYLCLEEEVDKESPR